MPPVRYNAENGFETQGLVRDPRLTASARTENREKKKKTAATGKSFALFHHAPFYCAPSVRTFWR